MNSSLLQACRRSVRLVAIALGLVAAAAPAFAAQPKDPVTTLDQKAFFRPELYISTSYQELDKVLDQLPNKAAWQTFASSRSGAVQAFIDQRSGAAVNIISAEPLIPGNGFGNDVTREGLGERLGRAVAQVDSDVVAAAVLQYVREHQDVLGIDARQLGRVKAVQVTSDLWQFSIPQAVNGVPVRFGRVAGTISHGNLVVIGTETWANVTIDVAPWLSADQAEAAGFAYVEGRTNDDKIAKGATLELVPVAPPQFQQGEGFAGLVGQGIEHRLVWSYEFQRLPELARWEVLVDARSGEVLSLQDKNQYVERRITGGAYPLTNTEICPNPDQCGIMQLNVPMPFTDTGLAAPNNFTNSAGIFQWTAGNTTTALNGRFVRMTDTCGLANGTGTGDILLGGANAQHDCTTPGTGGPGNTPASRSGMYELNKLIELAKGWLPTNTWLQGQLTANMNLTQTCNAFWNGSTVNFYRSGGGCRNTGEIAAVFDHEWGHGMDDNDAGGVLSNSSEAYADVAAIYRLEASCVGHGFFQTVNAGCGQTVDGTGFNANEAQQGAAHCDTDCSGVRDSDWAKHIPNTPDTALGFVCTSCLASSGPCGRQVHCAAAPIRQAAWDLVARDLTTAPFNLSSESAFIVGNRLFYQGSGNIGLWHACTCGATSDGCGATNGYMQWLAADDDNGNLNDGTPHMTALFAAYNRHGVACATPTPTNSGCAGGPTGATTLTASPGNFQVSLSWTAVAGATRYWVFRTEGHAGCNLGKALIAEVTGLSYVDTQVANGRTYYYNVVAAGASAACHGPAGNCLSATPTALPGPTNLVATATGPNQIGLTWTAVGGAASYRVYRANGACPQVSYAQIATGVLTNSYTDNTVSGGSTYAYVVTWVDASNSESGFSNCDDAVATGACTTPPTFAGLTSATSAGTTACAINLAWSAGTPTCTGTTLKYNVYRSTTAGTPPSPATLRQSCVTATNFTDTTVNNGTTYYYVVRAEDSQSTGTGACNNGIQDANVVERNAVPGGPVTTLTDDVESGGANWSTAGGTGTNPFTIVTSQSHSPTHSWFWPDPAVVTLQPLTRTSAVNIPAGGGTWSWWHIYQTESTFDGYLAEYSLDGGTTWSDILLGQGPVPANPNRFLLNPYNAVLSTGFNNPLPGRRAWSGSIAAFQEVRVDMNDFATRAVTVRWRAGSDNSVSATGVWIDDITFATVSSCTSVPTQSAAPEALAVDTAGNGVYQPNETVVVAPTWRNTGTGAITLTGALTNHTGPAGPTYSIPDGAADYGSIAVGGTATCGSNCYSVSNTAATRPLTHWDSTALETVTPTATTKTWTLHIGNSFTDVPASNGFYRFIETIFHKQVTGGCSGTTYCPSASTTREQMAVFVLVSKEGPAYSPPACTTPVFADVPASSPFCRWIEELARRGVVSGCGGGNYCPTAPATREQMAVFVLRTLDPTLNPPACTTPVFADVPASSPFCRWIEELVRRGVVTGCGGGNYCPTNPVTREQMAVFLTVTFGLTLYGL